MMKNQQLKALELLANQHRKRIIDMVYHAKAGHPGGSLSAIDLLTAIYELDVDFSKAGRSRVVLSKGHAVPAQYACLHHAGFISDEEMKRFRCVNSRLQGHPYSRDVPEADATTGMLGQGLSIGLGMAVAKRFDKADARVYVLCGDGELHEGQIWEAAQQAAHHRLNQLILIVDMNQLSSSGPTHEVIDLGDLKAKFEAFRFHVIEIDGHNMAEIVAAIQKAKLNERRPLCILAHTVKGKGISYMENNPKWHSGAISDDEYRQAVDELATKQSEILGDSAGHNHYSENAENADNADRREPKGDQAR